MDDQQLWNLGTGCLKELFEALPVRTGQALTQLLDCYRQTKEALAAVVAEIDAAAVCRDCGGQCCLNGKYRPNAFDYLASLVADHPVTADFTRKPLCPYGTASGCAFEPGLRPADCILFICDAIDRLLSSQARLTLAEREKALRECINEAFDLTGEQLGAPLLLWAEKRSA
jgi:hypothetical protein